jgi:hypothetical protein
VVGQTFGNDGKVTLLWEVFTNNLQGVEVTIIDDDTNWRLKVETDSPIGEIRSHEENFPVHNVSVPSSANVGIYKTLEQLIDRGIDSSAALEHDRLEVAGETTTLFEVCIVDLLPPSFFVTIEVVTHQQGTLKVWIVLVTEFWVIITIRRLENRAWEFHFFVTHISLLSYHALGLFIS